MSGDSENFIVGLSILWWALIGNEKTRYIMVNTENNFIEKLKNQIESDYPEIEIIAEELRNILRSFDGLLGLVDTEEVLGEIFANFCIGK